ncbi:tripartite tricarboxylate transporter permease [bacterium]|nr:MAG: tripartite tricarboxylate transporter permease [bacterium]
MTEIVENLSLGFNIAFTGANLLYCFIGVFIGTLIGVLPGIGPVGTISLLLPVTYGISPTSAIIMLAGIYYGAQYGGSTTSILVNIPGEASSVVTCLDGYQMAQQGRAGPALGIAAFGSFIAGSIGTVLIMFLSKPLAVVALKVGPPEYFSLMILALTILVYLCRGSMIKAIIMGILGVCLSLVGMDTITGSTRFTFEIPELEDGIDLIPMVMGLFGIGEILTNLQGSQEFQIVKGKIKGLLPNLKDWKDSIWAIIRGTFLGFFLGILPGGGSIIASFVSYAVEKKLSKHPERFGRGAIEGVAGPESANNAGSNGSFIPLFALGIPSNAVMALMLGALMINGVQPGPLFITEHPDIFWGTIVSMYIGNVFLVVLNLPLISLWVKLLKTPYGILFPLILFFCIIGTYSINNNTFDLFTMFIFGIIGYLFNKFKYEPAPLIMAFILGPKLETSLRRSLLMSQGNASIFFRRSISAWCLIIALLLLLSAIFLRKRMQIISKLG